MRNRILWLATASLIYASPSVFSVNDDFLAFPQVYIFATTSRRPANAPLQYEVVFSDTLISDKDAESRIAYAASSSSAGAQATSSSKDAPNTPEAAVELSRQRDSSQSTHHGKAGLEFEDLTESYESMILNGRHYLCAIPVVEVPDKNDTSYAQAKAKAAEQEAAELARATNRGWELLKDMEGNCIYFISGWWSYSFCYNTQVKQFHQLPPGKGTPIYPPVEDESTPSYVLGKFSKIKGLKQQQFDGKQSSRSGDSHGITELQAKGETRYLVQRLGGGTTCDLTGRERRVEIQFHCHPQSSDRIGWIKEVSTCSYLMVIYTPRLCNDVAFLPPLETKANPITCREIVPEAEMATWESRKIFAPQPKLVHSSSSSSQPIIAGIEVGAMNKVGKPGFRLDPPNIIVQPNGAVEISAMAAKGELLAKQEKGGKVESISDEELSKMGLDPKEVAAVKEKLKNVANGKSWKLEAFEGGDGTELRGILQGDDIGEEEENRDERVEGRRAGLKEPGGEEEEDGEGSEEEFKDEL